VHASLGISLSLGSLFVRLSPVRHTHAGQVPESLLYGENHLGGCPDFLSYSSPHILSAGMRGGESYHTFLNELAMLSSELQMGNPNEAMVLPHDPSMGSIRDRPYTLGH
jgi:hypothetical protein